MLSRPFLQIQKLLGHALVHLILQKAGHQLCPGILLLALLICLGRKQHPGLNIDQSGCHYQKLADQVQILGLHVVYIVQILLRYEHNGDIVDTHLVLLDEMEQKVQRPLKIVQFIGNPPWLLPPALFAVLLICRSFRKTAFSPQSIPDIWGSVNSVLGFSMIL
jgi:hypothetical protein